MCSVVTHDYNRAHDDALDDAFDDALDVEALLELVKRCLDDQSFDQLANVCQKLQSAVCDTSNQLAFWKFGGIAVLSNVLTQCQHGPNEVLVQACAVLAGITFDAEDLTDRSVDKAVQALRCLLDQTIDGPEEVRKGAYAAIDKVMCAETTLMQMTEHHATFNVACDVKTLVANIKQHLNDKSTTLLTHACWVLRQRLRNPQVMLSEADDATQTLIEVVRQYKDGPTDLLKHACAVLCVTNNCVPGKIDAMVDVLKHYAEGPDDLLDLACFVLFKTSKISANREMCHQVVNVIRRHLDGPVWLLYNACRALQRIAIDDANEESCAAAGGIRHLFELVTHYRDQGPTALLSSALVAIRIMTHNHNQGDVIRTVPADIQTLISVLSCYSDGPDVVLEEACSVLCNITWNKKNHASCQAECGACGGIEVVVGILRRCCSEASTLLAEACCLFINVTYANAENIARCSAAGGVQVVIAIIKTALEAVRKIASDASESRDVSMLGTKATCDVRSCACKSKHGFLLQKSCWALRNIIVDKRNQDLCSYYGGIEVLVDAVNQLCCDELRHQLCAALSAMTANNHDNQVKCIKSKGFEAAVRCIDFCGIDNVDKLHVACVLLSNITATYDQFDQFDAKLFHGIESVLWAVHRHWHAKSPPLFLKHACRVLANISKSNAQARVVCGKTKGVKVMIDILTHYCNYDLDAMIGDSDYFELVEATCCALSSMTTGNADNYATCCSDGGLHAVVGVLQAFRFGPASLLCEALRLMSDLTLNSKSCLGVSSAYYYAILLDVLKHNIHMPVVVEEACEVICNITCYAEHQLQCKKAGGIAILSAVITRYNNGCPGFAYLLHQARQALLSIFTFD